MLFSTVYRNSSRGMAWYGDILKLCFFKVTHLCWVPREPYILQTSEDKTIRWAH